MTSNSDAPTAKPTFRSPLLMNANDTAIVVVDVQEKLIGSIDGHEKVEWNIKRLLAAALALNVTACGSEQYPQGLGATIEPIATSLKSQSPFPIAEKTMFSCRECSALTDSLYDAGVHNLLLCGIETHVCVAQSALDFLAMGFNVFACVDAMGSRSVSDHRIGIRRMENNGVTVTTTESALFEWCETSKHPEFKSISKLVQESAPSNQ